MKCWGVQKALACVRSSLGDEIDNTNPQSLKSTSKPVNKQIMVKEIMVKL